MYHDYIICPNCGCPIFISEDCCPDCLTGINEIVSSRFYHLETQSVKADSISKKNKKKKRFFWQH